MSQSYKNYCKRAIASNPTVYRNLFHRDGSKKVLKMLDFGKKKTLEEKLNNDFKDIEKDGWKPEDEESESKPKHRTIPMKTLCECFKIDLTTWKMPKNPSRKVYNKIWMHNSRVKKYIKKLKEQNATTAKV